ncbi:MAG: hypothetical protein JJU00_15815, partial [Opitutales bacterium]|nr:hypothetical protein [Opitutales bacterium]
MTWLPIPSRRQEALLAYADAMEADLRRASHLVAGKSFFDGAAFYQPLKVLSYRPRAEDVMREGQVPLDREADSLEGRSWREREEKREEEKEKARPVADILKQSGGVILGDPGAGKSELLRWAVFERLKVFREAVRGGREEDLIPPVLVKIPQLAGNSETKLKTFHRQVLKEKGAREEQKGYPLPRLAVMKTLYDWAVSREGNLEHGVAVTLVRQLWRDWQGGRVRPFLALDSWDEVTGEKTRAQAREWLEPLIRLDGAILTSRIVGYEPLELVDSKREWRLLPLILQEAETLVKAHLGKSTQSEALCRELRQKPQVAVLASNPLALALIVKVFGHRDPVELPRTKSALYREVLHDLLGEPEARRKGRSVRSWLESREAKLRFLEAYAWYGYPRVDRSTDDFDAVLDRVWPKKDFPTSLKRSLGAGRDDLAEKLLVILTDDHGLLVPYGKGSYALVHKALLDYLAASYLARRINEELFNAKIVVHEGGKEFRVTARHYLDRKIWSPQHQEMIALLGGLVEDPEGLLGVLWKNKEDDIFNHRLCASLAASGESASVPDKRGNCFHEIFLSGWKRLTASCFPEPGKPEKSLKDALVAMVSNLERDFCRNWIATVFTRLEAEKDHGVCRRLAGVFGEVGAGLEGVARAELCSRLLERLKAEKDFGVRGSFVEVLVGVGAGLEGPARAELCSHLLERLKAERDYG